MNQKNSKTAVETQQGARRGYSSPEEFCMIFEEDMDALYSLALLLTGEHTAAEACFLAALEDCQKANDVFSGWARSWSRRAIVKEAIRRVAPIAAYRRRSASRIAMTKDAGILSLLIALPAFERFVFAMSVLERYSVHECAAFLNCDPREVQQARMWALRSIANSQTDPLPYSVTPFDRNAIATATVA